MGNVVFILNSSIKLHIRSENDVENVKFLEHPYNVLRNHYMEAVTC